MLGPLIVIATLGMGGAILAEAALSFLGLGIRPPFPSWGSMLSEARDQITTAPWLSIFPGLAIFFTVLGLNLLGDGLRDILDPQSRTRAAHERPRCSKSRTCASTSTRRPALRDAVEDVSFAIGRGETFGLVGESGCGKSITALAVMGLLRPPLSLGGGAHPCSTAEEIQTPAARPSCGALRGKRIAMIFQEPMTALNPLLAGRPADRRDVRAARGRVLARGERPRRRGAAPGARARARAARRATIRTSSPAACASA